MREIPAEDLRKACDLDWLGAQSSEDLDALETIIGQQRAVKALKFGLGIRASGFNVYVSGMPGTGRTTAVERFLEELAKNMPVPDDWCYVNNFSDQYRPRPIRLPAGQGESFEASMSELLEKVRAEILKAFESDEYAEHREQALGSFEEQRNELLRKFSQEAREQGFVLQRAPVGLVLIPVTQDGQPLSEEQLQSLDEHTQAELQRRQEELREQLQQVMRQIRNLEKDASKAVKDLDVEIALAAIKDLFDDVKDDYSDTPALGEYVDQVREDVLDHLDQFRSQNQEQQQQQARRRPTPGQDQERFFQRYAVNVVVDNSGLDGAPVITEPNPTFKRAFGRIEREAYFGTLVTDFTMIRGGSMHNANGGFMVLPIEGLLRNPLSWEALKRALRNNELTVEDPGEMTAMVTTKGLQPDPIPLSVKVILIGQPPLYQALYAADEEFRELFKVKADFDVTMDRTDENVRDYAAFVTTLCKDEDLKHVDTSGLARIIEYGSRLADDQTKLSTRFAELADVIREANYYATQDDVSYISSDQVDRAIRERFDRSSLARDRVHEYIDRNIILIDVDDAKVGQVNGLAVLQAGGISFGQPSRITATVGLGREGVIDIEREANLSGAIHTKGVMILAGHLLDRFATDKPLSLTARLVFEQSYSGVDGDSASSTELYALLSALSGVPIKQSIAVTGSVNQKGQVQAIGGVNEKIEGFFDVCKEKGLTGEQGVMIPEANVSNLMLKDEVIDAVQEGSFHIWSVTTIDEGIEHLTGKPAGKRTSDGAFEADTINGLVDTRLHELAGMMKNYGGTEA